MKVKIQKPRLLLLSFIIMFSLSGFQFYKRDNSYKNLRNNGIVTTATQTCVPLNKLIVKYIFEFKMADGRKFVRTTKTLDERSYVQERPEREVIYLLDKPEKFWELNDYENYSFGGSLFFFFGPYGLIGTFVCYGFLRIIDFFRLKKNRREFIKNVAQKTA
jgi:hypothetical protein